MSKSILIRGYRGRQLSTDRTKAPVDGCECGICEWLRLDGKPIRPSDSAAWDKLLNDNGVRRLELKQGVS